MFGSDCAPGFLRACRLSTSTRYRSRGPAVHSSSSMICGSMFVASVPMTIISLSATR